MPNDQKIIIPTERLPLVIGVVVVACSALYGAYRLFLFLLESLFPADEEVNKDFIIILFTLMAAGIIGLAWDYLQTGTWKFTFQKSIPTEQPRMAQAILRPGLSVVTSLALLIILWTGASFYCQLLYEAIYYTLTTNSLAKVPEQASEQVLTTIRGTFYLGTFFPIAAGGTFLCGCFAKQPLSYRALLVPPFIMYGLVNSSSIVRTGYPSAFPTFLHEALKHSQSVPLDAGKIAVIWLTAGSLFLVVVAILAVFAKFFAGLGQRLRQRLQSAQVL